jgi:Fe-Mn family superoxide dismutase
MYKLPELNYEYDKLEPYIDSATMKIHHTMHHQGYITKLNKYVDENKISPCSIACLQSNIDPSNSVMRNNAGGHFNHSFFWKAMTPDDMKRDINNYKLIKDRIIDKWGTVDNFYNEFEKKSLNLFGSGWTWLIIGPDDTLNIITTSNQDNPLMAKIDGVQKGVPVIVLDVWEHAYYLKYKNDRNSYIKSFLHVINWDFADKIIKKYNTLKLTNLLL